MTEARREAFNKRYAAGDARDRALARLGKRSKEKIEEGLPALGKLQAKVKRLAARDGYLKTHDGGLLKVRHAHASLNTLLQGGGAVVMKKGLAILYQKLLDAGWVPDLLSGVFHHAEHGRLGFAANVHDEWQMEVSEAYADTLGPMAADSIREAGEAFGLRCPLSGAWDKGRTWADTH